MTSNKEAHIPDSNMTASLVEIQTSRQRLSTTAHSIDRSEKLQDAAIVYAFGKKSLQKYFDTHDQS